MSDIPRYDGTRDHIIFIALNQRSGKMLSSLIFSPELSKNWRQVKSETKIMPG